MSHKNRSTTAHQKWNHSSHDNFFHHYAEQSLIESTFQRFLNIREKILRLIDPQKLKQSLRVADIGCNTGTQCFLWAELGHQVFGIDINQRFIDLARERNSKMPGDVTFYVGSATDLPWPDQSMDVCLVPELLEHIVDWRRCLDEFIRVLKPGGILYLSTTNKLCPIQEEFNLPLYAWYPGFLKRYFENLAMTTRPQLANYATYPAVHWFSFYSLRSALDPHQFDCLDRFDSRLYSNNKKMEKRVLRFIGSVPFLRFLGHVFTPYTALFAIKRT
jgi:ubiquinone/menaquinone biosynthesis C-methylase UbiE